VGVVNAAVVVTRYFGGVLLGASGLVRAYGAAAGGAVNLAGVVERKPFIECVAEADYAYGDKIKYELEQARFKVMNVTYASAVSFEMLVPPERADELQNLFQNITSGKAAVIFGGIIMC
jgi:putative IMPACT (imprinted ancient) family translation regulator